MTCLVVTLALCSATSGVLGEQSRYFTITVVDDDTGRGVPLVELTTTNRVRYYTDSNGIVAFHEPGLMGRDVYFHVKSHGYEYPRDGFNYAGLTLKVVEGGNAEIRIKRNNIAERLYRVTGEGIYSDSILTGRKAPTRQPVLNGLVMGQDSVLTAVYKGKVYWVWGDTSQASYPLGNFQVSGATSELPGNGGLDPEVGVDLSYFVDKKGFSREMAPVPGKGPTWLGGMVTLVDDSGRERLFAGYAKVDSAMKAQEVGIVEFNDQKELFEPVLKMDLDSPIRLREHPFRVVDGGVEYIHLSPVTRVRADVEHLMNPSSYEAFTCLKPGSRAKSNDVDRDGEGTARYAWKRNTAAIMPSEEAGLIKDNLLKADEALFHIRDCDTGKPVTYHGSSVSWNEYRGRWVMVMSEIFGTSVLGEVWYLEADTPLGPWVYARKIVTHDSYTFYNPRHHPMFDKESGRIIFFEGTYTNTFSGNPDLTPRYDYNQVMYKLDLSSPRLALPVPIYDLSENEVPGRFATVRAVPRNQHDLPIAFFAPDLPGVGTVPVCQEGGVLRVGRTGGSSPPFYALPADTAEPPPTVTPLYEYIRKSDGRRAYTTDGKWSTQGFQRSEHPVCLVWKNPTKMRLPLNRYAPP